jgi:hypothetical protein
MPASLFLLTLADSGDRKSECRRLAFKTVDDAEREARQNHRIESEQINSFAEGLKGKEREKYLSEHPLQLDPRTQFSDATFEPIAGAFIRGMSAASWDTDEGGQVLGGSSLKADTRAATLGGLVKVFDNGSIERTRASGNLEGSGFAFNRRLNIHLLAQQVTVAEALNDPLLRGQGFLPRFLFASPESIAGTRFLSAEKMQEKAYSDSRLQKYWERCKAIQATSQPIDHETGEVKPPVIQMSAQAETDWRSFYNETEREQVMLGEYAEIKPFASRSGELVRRLAASLAYFEGKAEIDTDIMASACAIVRHSLSEWVRYMGSAKPEPKLLQAEALMSWLRAKGWLKFNPRDLSREGPPSIRKAAARDPVLSLLVEKRHLLVTDGKQYKINPASPATTATTATNQNYQGVEPCDTVATTRDKTRSSPDLSQPVASMSQPAESVQSSTRAALLDVVANVANVAASQAEKPIYRGEF